jgi:hypothetical protein
MKTKLFLMALLIGGASVCNAQFIGANATTYGLSTGTGSGVAFFGAMAGQQSTSASMHNSFFGNYCGNANTTGSRNTFAGSLSGMANILANDNTFLGYQSGTANATGTRNTFAGSISGSLNTSGNDNVFSGYWSGKANTQGSRNTFIGTQAAQNHTIGTDNIAIGYMSGNGALKGTNNVFVGSNTGSGGSTGTSNTFVGYSAGAGSTGSSNIFIGNNAGNGVSGSNLLYIDNITTTTPLIWGDFNANDLKLNGRVGIDMGLTTFPANAVGVPLNTYRLFVNGGILAREVRVATTWADYVFEDDHVLPTLNEVERFIEENGHLPNVPSAKQVEEEGIEVGQMAKIQQEKIEELTLYAIAQDKQLSAQEKQLKEQAEKIAKLEKMVGQLMDKQ